MGVRVLAGPDKDVTVSDPPQATGKAKNDPRGVTIVFPVRRGDRRMIQIAEMLELRWKAWTVEESLVMVISVLSAGGALAAGGAP